MQRTIPTSAHDPIYEQVARQGLTNEFEHLNQIVIRAGHSDGDSNTYYQRIVQDTLDDLVDAGEAERRVDERGSRYYRFAQK